MSIGLYCALLAPQWKANLRSTSVQVMNTWPLGYSIKRLESQNRKFVPISINAGPKNDHFFVCKQTGFVNQRLWGFEKMTLIRVSSHWLWLESSHHLSQHDSSRAKVTKNRDSSRVIDSSHAITGPQNNVPAAPPSHRPCRRIEVTEEAVINEFNCAAQIYKRFHAPFGLN